MFEVMSSGVCLGQNRYGKAENRVFRLTRHGSHHEILDLNVTVQLSGDFEAMHTTGSNAACVATDSQKNTVFVMAQKLGGGAAMAPEAFAIALGRHFLSTYSHITRAEIAVEKYAWERISVDAVRFWPFPLAFPVVPPFQNVTLSACPPPPRLQAQRQLCTNRQGRTRPTRHRPPRLLSVCV